MLLSMNGIRAGYDRMEILHGIDITVSSGELVAIVGPNGSGKTTALKALIGLLKPTSGKVLFKDKEVTALATYMLVRMGMGFVPQGRIVFPRMTVEENLKLGCFTETDRRKITASLDWVLGFFPDLKARYKQRAGQLSGGEQQMLAIGRALMSRPRLLLMDEPSLGLSPRYVGLVFEKVVALKDEGIAILIVEQNANRALQTCDRGYVFDTGDIRFHGPGPALLADPEVRALYLGGA